MGHLEGNFTPVLYIGRKVLNVNSKNLGNLFTDCATARVTSRYAAFKDGSTIRLTQNYAHTYSIHNPCV